MSYVCFSKSVIKLFHTSNIKYCARTVTHCLNKTIDREHSYPSRVLNHNSPCCFTSSFRHLSNNTDTGRAKNVKVKPAYDELYLFEKIRFFRILGRFTKYSCLGFAFGAPLCVLSASANVMPTLTSQAIIANLTFYCAVFTGQSFIFSSRILGKMMISEDERTIKLSHLSLFGNRKDVFIKPSDIVPFSDVHSEVSNKKFVIIKLKNSKRFIFFPEMGSMGTDFEVIELILSGALNEEHGGD